MIELRISSQRDIDARHAEFRSKRARPAPRTPQVRNVEPVLSLGEMEFIHFRGRAYGVPPLPWKAGQRLLDLRTKTLAVASEIAKKGDAELEKVYYHHLSKVAKVLWKHSRPVGKTRRLLRWLGLHRNPFNQATELELLEHLDFFYSRRMKSGVQYAPTTPGSRPLIRTS